MEKAIECFEAAIRGYEQAGLTQKAEEIREALKKIGG
jgi:hypothetical protein